MSERIAKVESLVRQVVAGALLELLPNPAEVTVTAVDVSPDMRQATIWIGVLPGDDAEREAMFAIVRRQTHDVQQKVAKAMTTKFVPKLHFKLDGGGRYAAEIDQLLRNI